jgi:aspartate carbamoyltransferase regulatory subunit
MFRVFTEGNTVNEIFEAPQYVEPEHLAPVVVATSGAYSRSRMGDMYIGAGVYYKKDYPGNSAIKLPENLEQSSRSAELLATKIAAVKAPEEKVLYIENSSPYVMDMLTVRLPKMEDKGFIAVKNRELIEATIASLRKRPKKVVLRPCPAQVGNEGSRQKEAAALALLGAKKDNPNEIEMEVDPKLKLTGAKLSKITQSLAYKAIRELKMKKYKKRNRTEINVERAKAEAKDVSKIEPSEEKLWRSIRHRDMS